VYSLGICLYEMLTGSVPFTAESQVGVAMQHVRDPMPDVQSVRPEISAALAAIVERSTAKERSNRYPDAAEMVADLEQALAIEASRAGAVNGEATSVLRALPASTRDIAPRRLLRPRQVWLGFAAMLLAAAGVAAFLLLQANHNTATSESQPPPPPPARHVELLAAKDFDPAPGDGNEHPYEVQNAIDGNRSTSWSTETYSSGNFGSKPGVGLYVTAAAPVAARQLEVRSPTPGWRAAVYAARTAPAPTLAGWGKPIAQLHGLQKETVPLRTPTGERFRSYLIWLVKLPPAGQAQLSEVRLLG
jgi:hypothetical protein